MSKKDRHRARDTGRCPQCEGLFIKARSDALFCSDACRQRAHRNRPGPAKKGRPALSKHLTRGKLRLLLETHSWEEIHTALSGYLEEQGKEIVKLSEQATGRKKA